MSDFTVEARIWLTIICSRVSPFINLTNITTMYALMVACLFDNIPLNVGRFVLMEIRHYRNKRGPMILFPSLITDLYWRSGVDAFPKDGWASPKTPIYPLNIREEGALRRINKRKVDLERSVEDDVDSYRPSTAGPIDEISFDMRVIKELVSKFPQGLGESSTNGHSYVARSNYEKLLKGYKKKGATVANIDRAYSSLAYSHRVLRDSHEKTKKKKDKFFTKMWKG